MKQSDSYLMLTNDGAIKRDLAVYCALVNDKIRDIEVFKSKNSILKNSLKYLPQLTDSFAGTEMENVAKSLLNEAFKYIVTPNPYAEKMIIQEWDRLQASKNVKPQLQQSIKDISLHLSILLAVNEQRRDIEKQVLSEETNNALARLQKSYHQWHNIDEKKSAFYNLTLMILSAVMGLVLIHFSVAFI